MKSMTVGEFKAHFSDVLNDVKNGESIAVEYGKRKTKVAVLVPFSDYQGKAKKNLGVMEGRGSYRVKTGFSMSDEEFLSS